MAQETEFHCDIRASFATALSNWRRKNRIPLKKVARDLGLSIATINSWESGRRFPTGFNLELLADYTGVFTLPALLPKGGQLCPAAMSSVAAREKAISRPRVLVTSCTNRLPLTL